MIHRAGIFCIALILLACPAVAEEADAETRFHDAYVLEVIDGEIARAAKAYLALLGNEQVAEQIRDESRFRFAICTVLLGRPDEGRMQLTAIVKNERASARLRERAEAYLESISALGVGTELDRKLQSLIFDLGRADPNDDAVPAYRDVEIIGKPAVPFLERLLLHEDVTLRRHAFRLLILLGAEDLVARWNPGIPLEGSTYGQVVEGYLAARPEEVARLEARLLAFDDEVLMEVLDSLSSYIPWSLGFVRALTARGGDLPVLAFHYLARTGTSAEQWALARECILGTRVELRETASGWAVSQPDGPPEGLAKELWPPVLRSLAGSWGPWYPSEKVGTLSGNLVAWAKRVPVDLLLETLTELVVLGEAAAESGGRNPLQNRQLAIMVAHALAERELDAKQLDVLEGLVRRWTSAIAPTFEGEMGQYAANPVAKPLRSVVERLSVERAAALVKWVFEGPAHERAEWFEDVVQIQRPEDPSLLVEAVRAVMPEQQAILLHRLPKFSASRPSVEIALAELDALPTLLALTSVETVNDQRPGQRGFWGTVALLTDRVPDAALADSIDRLFETEVQRDEAEPRELFDRLVSFSAQTGVEVRKQGAFFARFLLPAVDAQSARLTVEVRRRVMQKALLPLQHRYGLTQRDKAGVATYVLRHLDDLQLNHWSILASYPDLFPLESWLSAIPPELMNARRPSFSFKREHVDAAMQTLAADASKLDDVVLKVLVSFASPEVAREVVDRMLAIQDAAIRHRVIGKLRVRTGYPASPAGLEAALAGLLADEDPDLEDLAEVASLLAHVKPSEKLLPAAERLLASDDPKLLLEGISLAKRLGRVELVPALARLLTSLDANMRDRAKSAIQSIQELKRLQEESGQPR